MGRNHQIDQSIFLPTIPGVRPKAAIWYWKIEPAKSGDKVVAFTEEIA